MQFFQQASIVSDSPNTRHLDVLEAQASNAVQQIENLDKRIEDLERERYRIIDTRNSLELRLWQMRHRIIKLEQNEKK